ncbi:MAG: MerR family transcriptional regulator [Corynebacterium sp.]|uniref:MerR family transcriptional regulator n=1 Tax=Corynebacterium sp. TaxID=1720 RepID=UPI0026DF4AC7|nr:MerR family transcriptional regulator [Corynebacterium sp.]MDO5670361.1 MerR family transcriptional regulator [Corynebacterium sp.]
MRIKELTAPRAIRHYHHEGLLHVPDSSGNRNYSLDHAVRLVRIRHLTESGLSLATIRELVHDPDLSLEDEIRLAEKAIDEQIAELHLQKTRLSELLEQRASDDDPLPYAVPERLAAFYGQISRRLNAEALPYFEKERQATEVALRIPLASQLVDDWLRGITPERIDATVEIYHLFARLPHMGPEEARAQFDDHMTRLHSVFGPDWGIHQRDWRGIVRPMLMAPGVVTFLTSAYHHPNQKEFIRLFLEQAVELFENNVSRETRGAAS